MGLAYYSKALQAEGKVPKCFGLSQDREGRFDPDENRELGPSTTDFKYYCLGYSAYAKGDKARKGEMGLLPYCEGIEVAVLEELDHEAMARSKAQQERRQKWQEAHAHLTTSAQDSASTSSEEPNSTSQVEQPASTFGSGPEKPSRPPLIERIMARASRNLESMQATLRNEGHYRLRKLDSVADIGTRVVEVTERNIWRMETAINLVADSVYHMAVKPVMEILASGEEEQPEN